MGPLKVEAGGREVELPRLTLDLDQLSGRALQEQGRARYEAELAFLSKTLPSDALAAEVGDDDVEGADLVALEALFARVLFAYAAPVARAQLMASRSVAAELADPRREGFGLVR